MLKASFSRCFFAGNEFGDEAAVEGVVHLFGYTNDNLNTQTAV